jgi:DNA-binding SARP family transcriptional activator
MSIREAVHPNADTWARKALLHAASAGEPLLETLANVALSELHLAERFEYLEHASISAGRTGSVELQRAVRALVANDTALGMLAGFMTRMRRDRPTSAPLEIDVVSATVRQGGAVVPMTERELAVLLALARSQRASAAAELADAIWPDLDGDSAQKALQTCVYRLRQKIGDPDAIQTSAHGYRLREGTVVDLWEIGPFVRSLGAAELDDFVRARLTGAIARLEGHRPDFLASSDWFTPVERQIAELLHVVRTRLAEAALAECNWTAAEQHARPMIAADEYDEQARSLLIRALLGTGDRVGATREFRAYRELLARELEEEPSDELYALLERTAPRARARA